MRSMVIIRESQRESNQRESNQFFFHFFSVKPIHTDTITTTTAAPTSKTAATEGITTKYSTTLGMSLATTANITQPPHTESTRQTGEIPGQKAEIPVFDPSNSVMLESFSDSSQSTSFCVSGFLSWLCAFSVVVVWCL